MFAVGIKMIHII